MKRIASLLLLTTMLVGLLAACGGAAPTTDTNAGGSTTNTNANAGSETNANANAGGETNANANMNMNANENANMNMNANENANTNSNANANSNANTNSNSNSNANANSNANTNSNSNSNANANANANSNSNSNASGSTGGALPDISGIDVGNIKIAFHGPLSGPQALFGTTGMNGAKLAVQQLGPQMGFKNLEIVPFDDQATENVGASNANQIAANQDIMCVDGHINSGVALAALPTYKSANLVMISPANTNPRITDDFAGVAYRLVGRDDVQGVVAADFASKNLQAKTAYVLNDQTAYGEGLATVFRDQAQKDGINVVGFAGTQETSAFDAVLTPILAANPDVVFYGGIYDRAGPLLQQMRERGIQAKFLGGDGLDSSDLARLAADAAVGANYVTVSGPASAYPAAAQFVKDYQQAYNTPAGYPAFQAYDAAKACMLGIANAAKAANGRPTRQQVQEGMKQVKSFEGVTGNVTFDDKGDRSPATYYIFEVKSADPAKWNTNEVVAQVQAEPPKK